jgi:polysaccharide pyruvyl transferase WcaK-like protein
MMIVPGTGILDDFGTGPSGLPAELYRWTAVARMFGAKVLLVSVGAGPIRNVASRRLMKRAAELATYRSFRDAISRDYMQGIGVGCGSDSVFPDLVFSLPSPIAGFEARKGQGEDGLTIGIGVMAYYGWESNPESGQQIYEDYIAKLTRLGRDLLKQRHSLRIVIGEIVDRKAARDLSVRLSQDADQSTVSRVKVPEVNGLEDVLREMAACDVVIATRFHNVVGALMVGKPVISIGYAKKNEVLLHEVGLGAYSQLIENFDVDRLMCAFSEVVERRAAIGNRIAKRVQEYRASLRRQLEAVVMHGASSPAVGVGQNIPS